MSVNSKMTAIADAIRSKTGGTNSLSLDDMATQIANISTGVELNFEVVGGTSQPSTPKANTIWVNTSTSITDWVFSATQPTAASGRVWIATGTSSAVEFNALKKNGIQVYPISAKQYIGGAWVDKTAKSYQNGAWVEWVTYLFQSGVGGLIDFASNSGANTTVTISTDKITSTYTGTSGVSGNVNSEAFDYTGKKYLCLDYICTVNNSVNSCNLILSKQRHTGQTATGLSYVVIQKIEKSATRSTLRIPLSEGLGALHLCIIGSAKYEIYNIWVEE